MGSGDRRESWAKVPGLDRVYRMLTRVVPPGRGRKPGGYHDGADLVAV